MTTLVVGATGRLGGRTCRLLGGRGHAVRGLVRPGSLKGAGLAAQGVEVARGDLRDPAGLEAACRGVEAVVSTATSIVAHRPGDSFERTDRDGHLALIDAAHRAGVRRFVFVSVSPNLAEDNPLVRAKRAVERALRASDLSWTVLQPSCFMEIWLGPPLGWDARRGHARIVGPGEAPISYISEADVAGFAVLALERPGAERRDLPLGGPEAVRPIDAVRIFEEAAGRPFAVRRLPAWLPSVARCALSPFDARGSVLMALADAVGRRGDPIEMTATLREFGVPMTSVRDFARQSSGRGADGEPGSS